MELTSLHRKTYGFYKVPADSARCCELVTGASSYTDSGQCSRKRGFGLEGAYCKQHDPEARKAKSDARYAAWMADHEAVKLQEAKDNHLPNNAQTFHDVLRLIADGHNDPRTIATETLAEFERTYPK